MRNSMHYILSKGIKPAAAMPKRIRQSGSMVDAAQASGGRLKNNRQKVQLRDAAVAQQPSQYYSAFQVAARLTDLHTVKTPAAEKSIQIDKP